MEKNNEADECDFLECSVRGGGEYVLGGFCSDCPKRLRENGDADMIEHSENRPTLWSVLELIGFIVVLVAILGFAGIGVYEVFFTANITEHFHKPDLVDTMGMSAQAAARYETPTTSASTRTTGEQK